MTSLKWVCLHEQLRFCASGDVVRRVNQTTTDTMTSLPDRRQAQRFEIVSPLWADIELPETAIVRNVSQTGALVESTTCPALNSRHAVTFRTDDRSAAATTIVRHVRPSARGRTFLVGLEAIETPIADVVARARETRSAADHRPVLGMPEADRRRMSRVACDETVYADISWPRPVRMADISSGGALLLSRQRGSVGARGLLRLTIGHHRFAAAVQVCRQTAFTDRSGFYLGVRFLGLIDHHRDLIDTLVTEA